MFPLRDWAPLFTLSAVFGKGEPEFRAVGLDTRVGVKKLKEDCVELIRIR